MLPPVGFGGNFLVPLDYSYHTIEYLPVYLYTDGVDHMGFRYIIAPKMALDVQMKPFIQS